MHQICEFTRFQDPAKYCPDLTSNELDYLKSTAFQEELTRVSDNPVEMARLTCALLKHFALDPTAGTHVNDFVIELDKTATDDEALYFICHLHCMVNFVGFFELPRKSVEAQQLLELIQQNLASRKFKAALMFRRLYRRSGHRYRRVEKAARVAYDKVVETLSPGINFRSYRDQEKVEQMRQEAKAAFEAAHVPLKDRLQQRMANVSKAAYDPEFQGSFYAVLGTFAARYIRPAQPA
jgi:hypothetical protein